MSTVVPVRRQQAREADARMPPSVPARTPVPQPVQPFIMPPAGIMTTDAFSNQLGRLGVGSQNLIEASNYVKTIFTPDYATMTALHRENWVVKRLINTVPEDMLKNWYDLESSHMTPDNKKRLRALERRTHVRDKILDGLRWGRLFGGALGFIVIDGHNDILDEPLDLDAVMPGSFKGLIIIDRWSGVSPGSSLVTDISDPDFGLPEYYTISADTLGFSFRVHHSRILRFAGRPIPRIDQIANQHWGASEVEHVLESLKKYDNTSHNVAMLVFSANLKVYKMEGMDQIATMTSKVQQDLYNTLTMMNHMMSSQGMQVIGEKDGFETHQYTFSGLDKVLEMFMLDVSGAADMPVTKLFARSPAGMNATGESDENNYSDSIEQKQEAELRPVFDKLLPIMFLSEFGLVPDDMEYNFVPYRRPTEAERKNLAQQVGNAVSSVFTAGIISQKTALVELRNTAQLTGMWTSITDEDIAKASDSYGLGGEDLPPEVVHALAGMKDGDGDGRPEDAQQDRAFVEPFHENANPAN